MMNTPCSVTADLCRYERQQEQANQHYKATAQERKDWIEDRKAELLEDPLALFDALYNSNIDTDQLLTKLIAVFKAPRQEQSLCVSELRDYLQEQFDAQASEEAEREIF